uniref:Inactive heme oxygenase 2, chloroplastic n=1 Tax=Ananas comosus var. bracteatus TaxID=296719 RepID=A0A6V7PNM8_ANACO|nr:unnamed protein product [Ananas comosus var. bracteatus]
MVSKRRLLCDRCNLSHSLETPSLSPTLSLSHCSPLRRLHLFLLLLPPSSYTHYYYYYYYYYYAHWSSGEEAEEVPQALPGRERGHRRRDALRSHEAPHPAPSGEKEEEKGEVDSGEESWRPSVEGFVKYLVDSKLVFDTVERIVDESSDVAYVYFRKTESSAPSFLCHFYNIYFAHINGGIPIGRKVCEKLFKGRELEFYKWDRNVQLLLKDVREKLNKLGEHWSREEKNRCLREAAKSFRYSGRLIRLIIL